ncbi:hypothetical protein Y032_0116g566 [Ancylostoma ceylanicum]|nr:hypothetical protein Y032_0116g566 [Ancylostoma ceylanicum]
MERVMQHLKNIRVGVVVVKDVSFIAFQMAYYENIKKIFTKFIREMAFPDSYSSVGRALYLARTMLEREKSKHKTIIIFNDGDKDRCDCANTIWTFGQVCRRDIDCDTGKRLIKQYTQSSEAKALIVGYTERRQQSFHLSLSRARVVQGVLSVRETRRASCSSLKDFVNKSDHPFGGLPVARFTFRGVQSLTVLVQRCSFRRISCAAHLILLNLA